MRGASLTGGSQLVLLLVGGFIEYYQLCEGELKLSKVFELESDAYQLDLATPDSKSEMNFSDKILIGKTNYHICLYQHTSSGFQLQSQINIKMPLETVTLLRIKNQYEIIIGTSVGKVVKVGI